MSRVSLRTFLITAKRHLQRAVSTNGQANFVIGNESADLDSICSALLYGYIQSSKLGSRAVEQTIIPVTNIPASDLSLRPELTALLRHANVEPSSLITMDDLRAGSLDPIKTSWTLVDHNAPQGPLRQHQLSNLVGVIDHHEDEHVVPASASPRIITVSGSCSSLVTNYLRSAWDDISSLATTIGAANGQPSDGLLDDAAFTTTWDAQVAILALGAMLIDTQNLKDENKTTEHDVRAVRYLEARINSSPRMGKTYDRDRFFKEISAAKEDLDGLSLEEVLRKDYKQWEEGDLVLGMSSVVKPISYLREKAKDDSKLENSLLEFAGKHQLQLFAVMTAFADEAGGFSRELLLVALKDGKATDAATAFVQRNSKQLQLEESPILASSDGTPETAEQQPPFIRFWQQRNVNASRKQVGPMIREAMR